MKKTCIIVIFCLVSCSSFSQKSKIVNTRVSISTTSDTLNVTYDLKGKRKAAVSLEVKDQNNQMIQPENVFGDIGKGIPPGNGKSIIWDMNADGLDLSGSSLKIRVKGSVYIPAHKKKINYPPPRWGYAFTVGSGCGIFTDDLMKKYRYNIPFVGYLDINYKRLALYLKDYIGYSETLIDIPYTGGTWAKGSRADVYNAEAALGYILLFNNAITFAPFAGIGSTYIGPIESELNKTPGLNEVELDFSTTYTFGLNLDFKINPSKIPTMDYAGLRWSSLFLRVRYTYNSIQFENKYPGFGGNMNTLTLSIGFGGGRY